MGDQSFARLIKKRRDALGLSQARLGELVGRSASTIRNWERALASPSDRSDVVALAAVLGLDEDEVLGQAGFGPAPVVEHSPTVEEVYASLTAETEVPVPAAEPVPEAPPARPWAEPSMVVGRDRDGERVEEPEDEPVEEVVEEVAEEVVVEEVVVAEVADDPAEVAAPTPPLPAQPEPRTVVPVSAGDPAESGDDAPPTDVPTDVPPPAVPASGGRRLRRAAPPTLLEAAAPVEASYVEDAYERRQYRVRALATAALVIAILIVLLWSFNRATDALGGLWDELIDSLAI